MDTPQNPYLDGTIDHERWQEGFEAGESYWRSLEKQRIHEQWTRENDAAR